MGSQTATYDYDVTIVGAGPYGLSAAAHLQALGLRVKAFGQPMSFWADTMPDGMLLRSPRVASTISDPQSRYSLEAFERATGTVPAAPLPLATFVKYGRWFEQQIGDVVDRRPVAKVSRRNSHFDVTLNDGARLSSGRVIVAAGIGAFRSTPDVFARLTSEQVSHCYDGRRLTDFAGRRVAVIGAGQSALESAALLHECGAQVEIVARIPVLRWIGCHGWLHNLGPISSLLYSKHDVGPMGISRLVAYPRLVSWFPPAGRERIRTRAIRAAGASWLPDRLRSVTVTTGRSVASAQSTDGEVRLTLDDRSERHVDHVLLGTGYRVNVAQYRFLSSFLLADVRQVNGWPVLASGFGSSVPRLHFIGAAAARSFGPLLHFVAGTEFASRELTRSLEKNGIDG